uniref:DOP1-like TPR domain-containing protein n=1 Tax=Panagrolaimus superbus TaxID=310955 RepID=A0A914Z2F6_9BILA
MYFRISVSADIAEFNTRASRNNFDDTSFAYHRALLDFASIVISLEYQMNVGLHIYNEQNKLPMNVDKSSFVVNQLNYNTPQSRATLRDPRVLVVELKLFISVIVNALQKLPGRHELWLQFLVNILPFLEKALPTICIHVVDQLCRNIDTCVNYAYGYTGATTFDNASIAEESLILHSPRRRASLTSNAEVYPENYSLIALEALTTIMHYCMLETPSISSSSTMGGVITISSAASTSIITPAGGSPTHSVNGFPGPSTNTSQNSATNTSSGSGAVVSAINMIPGTKGATEMIGNLFNKVFTSNEQSGSITSSVSKYDQRSAADIWRQARNEILRKLPQFLGM